MSQPPENINLNPEPMPSDPFSAEPVPQTPFTLLNDGHSIEMSPEGFDLHKAMHGREGTVFEQEGGKLYASDRDGARHLSSELGTPLPTSAFFAGHIAVQTGENIHIDFGTVIEGDDEGNPITRPGAVMPIGSYVQGLRENTDEIYAPQHSDFNFGVQTAYKDGRITAPPEMELSPEDQLVAAHAARKLLVDNKAGKFPYIPPRPRQ